MLALGASASGEELTLVRVDQHIADRDPLSVSFRMLEPDFRQDLGFEHLYVDAADPERFVRVSGAMYAVSPRTDYVALRSGVYPSVSPGTVFYIGAPSEAALGAISGAPSTRGISISVSTPLNHPVAWARPVGPPPVAVRTSTELAANQPMSEVVQDQTETPAAHDMGNPSYRAARLREIARGIAD